MGKTRELKAEIKNKLQSLRTTIELLKQGKDIPPSMVEISLSDLDKLEILVEEIKEGFWGGT